MSKNRIGVLREKLSLIEKDCSFIKKGIIRAAYHHSKNDYNHINQIEDLVLNKYKMQIFYDKSASDENTCFFFIYEHPVTRIFINIINGEVDPVIKEYLVGVLLGYSDEYIYKNFKEACIHLAKRYNTSTEEIENAYYKYT